MPSPCHRHTIDMPSTCHATIAMPSSAKGSPPACITPVQGGPVTDRVVDPQLSFSQQIVRFCVRPGLQALMPKLESDCVAHQRKNAFEEQVSHHAVHMTRPGCIPRVTAQVLVVVHMGDGRGPISSPNHMAAPNESTHLSVDAYRPHSLCIVCHSTNHA